MKLRPGAAGRAFDLHAGPRRSQHVQPFGGADRVNAEEVRAVADDNQPPHPVGAGNHRDAPRRLLAVAALGLGDDRALRNPHGHQVLAPHGTFVVLVAAVAAQGDHQRRDAVLVERTRVLQAGSIDRRGPSVVLRRAKDADCVRRRGLILPCINLNLRVNPITPAQSP